MESSCKIDQNYNFKPFQPLSYSNATVLYIDAENV